MQVDLLIKIASLNSPPIVYLTPFQKLPYNTGKGKTPPTWPGLEVEYSEKQPKKYVPVDH